MSELENFEKEYMIEVKGGKYNPSFVDEEKVVFDIGVCKYPTTQKMWLEVTESNPSKFKDNDKPVENISWWEALEYCNRLSERYKLEPVYVIIYEDSNKISLKINQIGGSPTEPNEANFKNTEGFRLPTEIEWEWFTRGGEKAVDKEIFDYTYSGSNDIDEVAWYDANSNKSTQNVGLKKPNQLGLYDCSGNVREWCYDTTENIENEKEYVYKSCSKYRQLRGGSWNSPKASCIIYDRSYGLAIEAKSYESVGFRIVRTILIK
ncbi:transcriptional regulator [Fusobacterium sp. HMSC064B11]|uniref:formylglycine-generating enzyme family protein n=1 Tax=Fusobacterium sp. HMSC064B11 TaxID=1739543 RepID=UPI0008A3C368|nr:SUMF1/EgtB/PvdO family nonheme iron enzyme [Fusobacterium sp. HMSC064B11]OFO31728.1 transcriptional regulator [Fusobacterium sp. HMSC064B11]